LYYCQAADQHSEKFMLCGVCEGQKGQQQVIAGTGKYVGHGAHGHQRTLGAYPTIKPARSSPALAKLAPPE